MQGVRRGYIYDLNIGTVDHRSPVAGRFTPAPTGGHGFGLCSVASADNPRNQFVGRVKEMAYLQEGIRMSTGDETVADHGDIQGLLLAAHSVNSRMVIEATFTFQKNRTPCQAR